MAVSARYVYWSGNSLIGRAKLDGTGVEPSFIVDLPSPFGLAVSGRDLYWTTGSDTIARSRLDGSAINESFITGANFPVAVAVDTESRW